MPLVRIDLPEGKPEAHLAAIGDIVYDAMRSTLNVPQGDRFQIFTTHAPGTLSIDKSYLGIERSDDCVIIQVTLNHGRSVAMKQAFYRAVADVRRSTRYQVSISPLPLTEIVPLGSHTNSSPIRS